MNQLKINDLKDILCFKFNYNMGYLNYLNHEFTDSSEIFEMVLFLKLNYSEKIILLNNIFLS